MSETDQPKPPPVLSRRLCGQCGKPYRPLRSDARFCSDRCRQRAHRARITVTKRDTHDTEFRVEQGESEERMSETDKPKTPPPSDPAAPAPDPELRSTANGIEFWYVGQEHVAQLVAEGWTATPAFPGSRDFAFLMQRPAPQTDAPEDQTA